MSEQDITIMKRIMTRDKKRVSRLYYYQGNFFYPFLSLDGSEAGRVNRLIAQFKRDNAEMVKTDRSHPDYLTLPKLFDSQPCGISL